MKERRETYKYLLSDVAKKSFVTNLFLIYTFEVKCRLNLKIINRVNLKNKVKDRRIYLKRDYTSPCVDI
jgi:hypothetical protein